MRIDVAGGASPVEHHPLLDHAGAVRGDQRQRHRVEPMLGGEHALGERVRIVAGQHRHRRLGDDRPVVNRGADIVDRAAVDADARLDGSGVGVEAAERRQ